MESLGGLPRLLDSSDHPANINDAAAWMQNRLDGTIHPALNTDNLDIIYDNYKQAFTILKDGDKPDLRAIYQEAENRKVAFIATINRYNVDARRHGIVEMDVRAEHTWEQVLSLQRGFLEERREAEASKGLKGFIHTKMRRFGENSETFQAWLMLLPTDSHYLSVLCGGLKLLLGAAQRMAEIRESVRNMIDEIPSTVSRAKQYIEIFEDSPELHRCNADLYVAIINALDAILQQCQQHVARRLSSAIFKQNMSGKELQDKIKDIEIYTSRLANQASISSMQRQKISVHGIQDLTKMTIISARSQDRGFNTMALSQSDHNRRLQSVESTLNQFLNLLKASLRPAADFVPSTARLESGIADKQHAIALSRAPSPSAALEQQQIRQELNDLLSKLCVDHQTDVVATDLSIHLNLVYTLSLPSQGRVVALITSPHLQTWLTSPSSSTLHVNGQMFSHEHEARQSPLSYFCAKFIDSILVRHKPNQQITGTPIVATCWFCGQHTNMRTDYDAHPQGMLNNLLAQLIHQMIRSTPHPKSFDFRLPKIDPQLSELCDLFVQLAEAFPLDTILFCIIDGISYYEDTDRQIECAQVLSMLTNLTRRAVNGPLIKLLVTASLRSHCAHEFFEADEVLNMDECYPSNGGFSALQWDVGVGWAIDQ